MDTNKLNEYLHRIIQPHQCFVIGVLPHDLLSSQIVHSYPACAIVNTDASDKPGQHWVAFYFSSPVNYEFFDSYGYGPMFYGFEKLWQTPSRWSEAVLQPNLATSCAQFCLYYLHKKSLGFCLADILCSFSLIDLNWNDKLVRKFVHKFTNLPRFIHSTNLPPVKTQFARKKILVSFSII